MGQHQPPAQLGGLDVVFDCLDEDLEVLPDARVDRGREQCPQILRSPACVGAVAIVDARLQVQDVFIESRDARLARLFRVVPGIDRERYLRILVGLPDPGRWLCGTVQRQDTGQDRQRNDGGNANGSAR
jgi:hypothetical protein